LVAAVKCVLHLMAKQALSDPSLIRKFRRSLVLATVAIFALGLMASLLVRGGSSLWETATWAAICSPILVGIAICLLQPVERMAIALGLSNGQLLPHLRPVIVFWAMAGIALPWIAAWLMADFSGVAIASWWQKSGADASQSFLWAIRLVAGALTYSLASALGVLLTYHFSSETDPTGD
jgi:hypothetical protein